MEGFRSQADPNLVSCRMGGETDAKVFACKTVAVLDGLPPYNVFPFSDTLIGSAKCLRTIRNAPLFATLSSRSRTAQRSSGLMKQPGRIATRLFCILWTLGRYGVDEHLLSLPLFRPIHWVIYILPWNWWRRNRPPLPQRIRQALEDLGPAFIKFGQILSTRGDILSEEMIRELALLQDRVTPFDGNLARAEIERALGRPISEIYDSFDTEPLASASIAQVHTARLNGTTVIVKVLRPHIEKVVRQDINLMYALAGAIEWVWRAGRRLRPVDLVAEYERIILDELDLMREAANANQMHRNFQDSDLLYIPKVYWDYTTRSVMTMEHVSGIRISDHEALLRAGVDLRQLAEQSVEILFRQLFDYNFFHADMHPGNIFISAENPESPRYNLIDLGIVGSLSRFDLLYLALNFSALLKHDYRQIAELHIRSGWVPKNTRVEDFEAAVRTVSEPILQRPATEISFGALLWQLFQVTHRFHMEIQPQLALLQKTLVNVEGIARDLYPQLNLWATTKPFIDRWVREHTGIAALAREAKAHLVPKVLIHLAAAPTPVDEEKRLAEELREQRRRTRWLKVWIVSLLVVLGWLVYRWGMHT